MIYLAMSLREKVRQTQHNLKVEAETKAKEEEERAKKAAVEKQAAFDLEVNSYRKKLKAVDSKGILEKVNRELLNKKGRIVEVTRTFLYCSYNYGEETGCSRELFVTDALTWSRTKGSRRHKRTAINIIWIGVKDRLFGVGDDPQTLQMGTIEFEGEEGYYTKLGGVEKFVLDSFRGRPNVVSYTPVIEGSDGEEIKAENMSDARNQIMDQIVLKFANGFFV